MNEIAERLPGNRVSHSTDESIIVNWEGLVAGASYRPNDGKWTVAVHDISNGDMDTGNKKSEVEETREQAIIRLCEMCSEMLILREV